MWSSPPSREVFADSVERKALENAAAVAASGCSPNAALHGTVAADECGIAFDLFGGAEVFKRTPYISDLKPAGRFVAKDLFEASDVSLLMKTLLDNGFMHGECMTATGYGMAESLKRLTFEKRRPAWQPRGSAFESGCLWKYAQQMGPARHGAVTRPGGAAEKAACYADI
jgi:dihydroxyacid dehydratase/phosphogluconate dehydratase